MTPEAWVALVSGLLSVFGGMITAAWIMSAQLSKALTKMASMGEQHAEEIKEVKEGLKEVNSSVEKLGDIVTLVAVQKEEIRALREIQTQNTKRTDETFNRIFGILDKRI